MSEESQVFEVEIKVSAHGQESVSIHREYASNQKTSTDGVARQLFDALPPIERSRMRSVSDGD